MRLTLTAAGGLLAMVGFASGAAAAVPIDRPSPPPYCADGKCYPKTETWGFYQGRWRSWPGVDERPGPHGPSPTPAELLGPDLKQYETPLPQDEDRRAPPPTQPPERALPTIPSVPPEGGGPETDGAPGPGAVPTGPGMERPGPPAPGIEGPAEPRVMMPIPSGRPALPRSGEEDADFPPALPFGSNPLPPIETPQLPFGSPTPDALPGNVPGDLPIPPDGAQLRRDRLQRSATDDPPPPLPMALGGLASR